MQPRSKFESSVGLWKNCWNKQLPLFMNGIQMKLTSKFNQGSLKSSPSIPTEYFLLIFQVEDSLIKSESLWGQWAAKLVTGQIFRKPARYEVQIARFRKRKEEKKNVLWL